PEPGPTEVPPAGRRGARLDAPGVRVLGHLNRLLPVVLAGAVAGGACSGSGTPPGGPASAGESCKPSGSQLQITAMDTAFDTECLAAPAGRPFTIRFDNEDSNTHNLDIQIGRAHV